MLINPHGPLPVLPGTKLLTDGLGLEGTTFEDPIDPERFWTIKRLFAPIRGRHLGGIRAKVVDNKSCLSFVNQRDLELLLSLAKPGQWCAWQGAKYPYINDELDGWFGLNCDSEDLLDDLHEHELVLRQGYQHHYNYDHIPSGVEHTRRIHMGQNSDVEELLLFLWDKDPETGMGPDGRRETLMRRWKSVERRRLRWDALPP